MKNSLLKFNDLEWDEPKLGVKQKVFSDGKSKLRLLQFDESFIEEEWCMKGHVGYVVDGEMTIDFNSIIKHYRRGDGLWIEPGESNKHKVIMKPGSKVELILFESVD